MKHFKILFLCLTFASFIFVGCGNDGPTNYTITASASENGTISPNGNVTVAENGTQQFTIAANSGYEIDQVLIDGTNNPEAVSNGGYTFSNVTANHTIAASFNETFTSNHLKIGDNETLFTNGFLLDVGYYFNPNTFFYELVLCTGTVQVYPNGFISGYGNLVLLDIVVNPEQPSGTYTFTNDVGFPDTDNTDNNDIIPGMLLKSSLVHKDFGYPQRTEYAITSGQVTIKVEGDIYKITFSFTTDKGTPVSGYYKGSLIYHDFTWFHRIISY